MFVFDADMNLVYPGAPDADYQEPALNAQWVRDALDAVLNGSEPPPSTTPVGCSIKWKK